MRLSFVIPVVGVLTALGQPAWMHWPERTEAMPPRHPVQDDIALPPGGDNVPVEDSRYQKDANTSAYRESSQQTRQEALDRQLKGIDADAARAVLADLRGCSPQDGRILYDLILARGYKRGLEIGTGQGGSAIWMGLAFKKNLGKLVTIEIDAEQAKAAVEVFKKAGLDGVIECRNNDAFKEVPKLQGTFDFVFMDTGTPQHKKFLDLVYSHVAPGGAITSHEANYFEKYMPDFLKAITTDPNLETTITRTPTGGISASIKKK